MELVKVNLNLARFVERSSGVFGKSGTGKSFITRTILAGMQAYRGNPLSCRAENQATKHRKFGGRDSGGGREIQREMKRGRPSAGNSDGLSCFTSGSTSRINVHGF